MRVIPSLPRRSEADVLLEVPLEPRQLSMVAHAGARPTDATHSSAPDNARDPHRVLSSGGDSSSSAAVKKPALSTNPPRVSVRSPSVLGSWSEAVPANSSRPWVRDLILHVSEALMSEHQQRFKVIIGGSGPAAIEAALVLRQLAGALVETTIVTPDEECVHLPMTVLAPFARSGGTRYPLAELVSDAGAILRRGTIASVDPASREVRTADGESLVYDALLIAVGGVQQFPYPRALAYGGPGADERMHGLIQDIEAGYVKRVAFVVAPGVSWPLPLYELALMTAERADEMCAHVELTLVTPETSALGLFGPDTARDVGDLLDAAGITLRANTRADVPTGNLVELHPEGERLRVDRVVTLPTLMGPRIHGLPHDAAGFLPVDPYGRVSGTPGVYAAGDATDFAIKQGGIACQQADAAAEAIAAAAGAGIEPSPFAPALRALLVTEYDARWLRHDLSSEDGGTSTAAGQPEVPPWTKIVGRELSRHLTQVPARMHP
jgi:sulfide:quinone oxidoreductase